MRPGYVGALGRWRAGCVPALIGGDQMKRAAIVFAVSLMFAAGLSGPGLHRPKCANGPTFRQTRAANAPYMPSAGTRIVTGAPVRVDAPTRTGSERRRCNVPGTYSCRYGLWLRAEL